MKIIHSSIPLTCRLVLAGLLIFPIVRCSSSKWEVPEELRREAIDHLGYGEFLEEKGEYLLAINEFLKAAELSPRPAVYYHLGHCYLSLNEPERAIEYLQKALQLAPDYGLAKIELARAKLHRQRIASAQVPAAKAAPPPPAVTPVKAASHSSSGNETRTKERPAPIFPFPTRKEKKPVLHKGVSLPPRDEIKKVLFPRLYGESRAAVEEENQLKRYIDRKKKSLDSFAFHLDKARHYRKHKLYNTAILEYSDALKANPTSLAALCEMADLYRLTGRKERAEEIFRRAQQNFADSARFFLKWGNLYLNLGLLKDAVARYNQALTLSPDYVAALNNLGVVELRQKHYGRAADYFQSALEKNPRFAAAHLNLGIIYQDYVNQPKKARQHYEAYLKLGGKRASEVRKWLKDLGE